MSQTAWRIVVKNYLWVAALLAALAFMAADDVPRLREIRAEEAGFSTTRPPALDPASPTGYAFGQRTLILPGAGMDGYQWIMQTQLMLAGAGSRIRTVSYDGPPGGREVHWSSSFRWWLAGIAWIHHVATGTPLMISVERVAPYANTVLFVLILAGLVPIVARRFGSAAAAALALGTVGVRAYFTQFLVGTPGHGGLAATCGFLTVLFLLAGGAGWVTGDGIQSRRKATFANAIADWLPSETQARSWFIASAVAGGAGLWISAATEIPLLIGVGLGAVVATGWLARGEEPDGRWRADPALWRAWGVAGGATSLFFYLLEYFPSAFGWRLEVNHPLYALAWVGGGELAYRACLWMKGEVVAASWKDRALVAASLAAVLTPPAVVTLYPAQTFWVADPFLFTLHEAIILEFARMTRYISSNRWETLLTDVSVIPLCGLAIPMVLWRRAWPGPAKAMLALGWPAGLLTFALAMRQIRWVTSTDVVWLAILPAAVFLVTQDAELRSHRGMRIAGSVFLGTVLFLSPLMVARGWVLRGWSVAMDWNDLITMVTRDVAQQLRAEVGGKPVTIASGPTTTTWMVYYGGFRGLGSLYWENMPGLKETGLILGAQQPEIVHTVLQEDGVTHIAIFSWDQFLSEASFANQMLHSGQVPEWLHEIPYTLPSDPRLQGAWVKIYEVRP